MSKKSNDSTSNGISALGVIGVLFVVLKLFGVTEVATWSWWWVTAPFWGGLAVALALFVIACIVAVLVASFSK